MAVADLLVQIDAQTELLRRELRRGETAVTTFDKNVNTRLDGLRRGFDTFSRGVARSFAAAGITIGFAAITQGIGATISAAANLGDTADNIGITAEALQRLGFAAEQNGSSALQMEDALRRLTRRAGLFAQDGGGPAAKAIQQLGLQITDTTGRVKGAEQLFFDIVRALEDVEDQAEVAALASQFFGEDAGPKLVSLLRKGVAGIQEVGDAAEVLANDMVRDAQRIDDEYNALVDTIENRWKRAVLDVAGAFLDQRARVDQTTRGLDSYAKTLDDVADKWERMGILLQAPVFLPENLQNLTGLNNGLNSIEDIRRGADILRTFRPLADLTPNQGGPAPEAPAPTMDLTDLSTALADRAAKVEATTRAIRDQRSTLDQLNAALRDEAALIGLSSREREVAITLQRAHEAAQRDYNSGLRETPLLLQAEIDSLRARTEQIYDAEQSQRGLTDATKDFQEESQAAAREFNAFGRSAENALADVVLGFDDARGALNSFIQDLARLSFSSAFSNIFGFGGGGGLLGQVFGRASGGPVTANQPYMVGERGPELFVPRASGTIVPNGRSGGRAGPVFQVDMRGASVEAVTRLERFVTSLDGSIEKRAVSAVVSERRRSPGLLT